MRADNRSVKDHKQQEIMLENCSACAESLDVTDFEPFTKVICPKCEQETRVKCQLGKYTLERRHAVGGMSVVYVAEDTTLDRKVAVKILNEQYSSDETRVAAFENEARLTAAVNHPNVVRIFTVGRNHDRFYLVMELIEGQNFEIVMKERGALPEDEVLEIALEVAEGLRAANDAGVLHRDVKPGNILFTKDGRTKLVDFGLALITQGGSAQAEEIWATPYYVPPEALEKGKEDFRSDLYAFGATLYHALYGKPPFESTSNGTKVLKRAKQTIPRLKKVAPWLGNHTCEAVDRMMAYQPKHRWSSYDEVIKILKKARREANGASAQAIHGNARARRRSRKQPVIWGSIAAALVTIAAALFLLRLGTSDHEADQVPIIEARPTETKVAREGFSRETRRAEAWKSAHVQVTAENYASSYQQLIALSETPDEDLETKTFSRTVALLSLYLDGRGDRIPHELPQLRENLANLPDTTAGYKRLTKLVRALAQNAPINPSSFSQPPQTIADWTALLAVGFKLWDQGKATEANAIFAQVSHADLAKDHPWFSSYQDKLTAYQHDANLLSEIAGDKRPTDLAETEEAIKNTEDIAKSLKTSGRAIYTVNSRIIFLSRLHKSFQLRPYAHPHLDWPELLELIEQSAAKCQFKKTKGLLKNEVAQPYHETLAAWDYLLSEASLFLANFQGKRNWSVTQKDGAVITVKKSHSDGITTSDGQKLPWSHLSPTSLLNAHRKLAESDPHRQDEIAFAWLTGLPDAAEAMADELIAQDADFASTWRKVVIGLSQ